MAGVGDAIARRQLGATGVAAALDQLTVEEVAAMLGEPKRLQRFAEDASQAWKPGDGRPAFADNDPAVLDVIGRCVITRLEGAVERVRTGAAHDGPCGFCDVPLAELLKACSWGVWVGRYVIADLFVWEGDDGGRYIRDAGGSDQYQNPAWEEWRRLGRHERAARIRAVQAATRGV